MAFTAPPRPPDSSPPGSIEPIDRGELEALIEALIEEARQRARRRRRRYGAIVLLIAAVGSCGVPRRRRARRGRGGNSRHSPRPGGAKPGRGHAVGVAARSAPGRHHLRVGDRVRPAHTEHGLHRGHERQARRLSGGGGPCRGGACTRRATPGSTGARSGSSPISTRVDALAADPRRPGTLYAGTGVAVYKTVNGGRSWRGWNRGLLPSPPVIKRGQMKGTPGWRRAEGWVGALAVDPVDSRIVWAGSGGGVKKSTDGGRSWKTVLWRGRYMGVGALAIAPTRPQTVYAGVSYSTPANCGIGFFIPCVDEAVLLKTTDGGATWKPTGLVLAGPQEPSALLVDLRRPSTLYAAVGATVLESDDGGDSWKTISHGGGSDDQALPGNHRVSSLAVDPSGAVFAAAPTDDGGIFKTTDAGATWTHVVSGVAVDHVAVDPRQPTTIYAVGTQWSRVGTPAVQANKTLVLRSTDGGRTWSSAG